jgi:hypothetical protein
MKYLFAFLPLCIFYPPALPAQLNLSVVEVQKGRLPGVQSFALGTHEGDWLIIGGRIDGLHRRQPWASFDPADNNTFLIVANPVSGIFWTAPIDSFPPPLVEQLQSTNICYMQVGTELYLIGGYGYSGLAGDHITYPALTVVDLPNAIQAVKSGNDPQAHFEYIFDEKLRVTGGELGYMDGWFYLMGGQNFEGRYNPMGPTHGPGFKQEYTNAVRKFRLEKINQQWQIEDFTEWYDSLQLHRRDYNAVPQVFPDGSRGFTMFSGVFRPDADLPWLNTVDVDEYGYAVKDGFNQYLNQYHSAHVALYDATDNQMHTVFFGGISRYYIDANGTMIDDPNVPFVNTVSQVSRVGDGSMTEYKIGEMPSLLGAGAVFIPVVESTDGIIDLIDLPANDSTLLGYVYGGIESTEPNIFFTSEGDQSVASGRVFEVWYKPDFSTSAKFIEKSPRDYYNLQAYPNPFSDIVNISFDVPIAERLRLDVYDTSGKIGENNLR